MSIHVIPIGDEKPHETTHECACRPTVEWVDPTDGKPYENGPLVIHNSYDGREYVERAIGESLVKGSRWKVIEV